MVYRINNKRRTKDISIAHNKIASMRNTGWNEIYQAIVTKIKIKTFPWKSEANQLGEFEEFSIEVECSLTIEFSGKMKFESVGIVQQSKKDERECIYVEGQGQSS